MLKQYKLRFYNFRLIIFLLAISLIGVTLVGTAASDLRSKHILQTGKQPERGKETERG